MSLVFPKLPGRRFVAGVMLAVLASADAQQPAGRSGPKAQFTEPGPALRTNAPVSTNAHETAPKKSGPGLFDHTVRKPFEFFNAEDSFSGAAAPPIRHGRSSALNNKRARELLDRKKNWVFNTPEDMYGLQTPEQMMNMPEYGPDGEVKKPKTSLERYFERMEKNRTAAATNRVKDDSLASWLKHAEGEEKPDLGKDKEDDKEEDSPAFGPGQPNSWRTQGIADFSGPLRGGAGSAEKSQGEYFNLGGSGAGFKPAVPDPAVAGRMQAFKQLLDAHSAVSPGPGSSFDIPGSSSPTVPPLRSPFSADGFGRDSFSPQPAPRPSSLPSIAPAATPSYAPAINPVPAAPATPAPRTFTAPKPGFELPQRKF